MTQPQILLDHTEPDAHMFPSDLDEFAHSETTATAFSIAVGSPGEHSEPLYRESKVKGLLAEVQIPLQQALQESREANAFLRSENERINERANDEAELNAKLMAEIDRLKGGEV